MSETTKVRNEGFAEKPVSRIWKEVPSEDNPYIARRAHLHGYELGALVSRVSFPATLFLLFKGELPTPTQERLLEALLVAATSLGPRHAAVRAAQLAGNGKTDPVHILPIGLAALGGEATRVPDVMKFLVRAQRNSQVQMLEKILSDASVPLEESLPGFGRYFGGRDLLIVQMANILRDVAGDDGYLAWGHSMSEALATMDAGWARVGLVAAALLDLGFPARAGSILYQLMSVPSLAALGLEMHGLPRTAMPFLSDDKYIFLQQNGGATDEQ